MGHIKKDYYKGKRDQKKERYCKGKKDNDDDKAFPAPSASPFHPSVNGCTIVARDEAIVDSSATVHLIKNDRIIASFRKKVSTDITTAGTSSEKVNACTELKGATIVGRGDRKGGVYDLGITGRSGTERACASED